MGEITVFGRALCISRCRTMNLSLPIKAIFTTPWYFFQLSFSLNWDNSDLFAKEKTMHEQIPQERKTFLARDYSRGFIEYCQFKAEVIERGYFQSTVAIEEHHRQQDGFIHAGVMATMADHTAGYSAFTTVSEDFQILTIEFKINFLRPAFGEALVCRSKVLREGGQIIISESEVFDIREGGAELAAKAMVTLMAVHRDKLVLKG